VNKEDWETVCKKVYWDRTIPLERWQERIAAGHRSYLPDAVSILNPVEFARYYGSENFKRDWPRLRSMLPAEFLQFAPVYDAAWSHAVGGGWNLKPTPDYFSMPKRRKAFLTEIVRTLGIASMASPSTLDFSIDELMITLSISLRPERFGR